MTTSQHVYEVRPRKDKLGVDLISDALPFGHLWYGEPNSISNAIGYAQFYSRSQNAAICVYDLAGDIDRKLYSAYENNRSINYWFIDCHCMGAG